MVNYYFGSKEKLFAEAKALVASPTEILSQALEAAQGRPAAQQAAHLLETMLSVWEGEGNAGRIAEVWRRTIDDPKMNSTVPQFFTEHVIVLLAEHIRGRDATVRAAGIAAVIMGMATSRFLMRLEPVASMSRGEVVRLMTPAVAAYLR